MDDGVIPLPPIARKSIARLFEYSNRHNASFPSFSRIPELQPGRICRSNDSELRAYLIESNIPQLYCPKTVIEFVQQAESSDEADARFNEGMVQSMIQLVSGFFAGSQTPDPGLFVYFVKACCVRSTAVRVREWQSWMFLILLTKVLRTGSTF
jgi:hypothetical protein